MASSIRRAISRFRELFRQGESNREFSDEVETHLQLLTERFLRQGMNRKEAAGAARRQFGNSTLLEQRQREARVWPWILTVFNDVRYAMRILAKSPGITAIAVASLALGIGANTAIFTVAKAALFDALAVPHPEQLRLLAYAQVDRSVIVNDWGDFYADAMGRTILASFSWPVYNQLQRQNQGARHLSSAKP